MIYSIDFLFNPNQDSRYKSKIILFVVVQLAIFNSLQHVKCAREAVPDLHDQII